MPYKGAYHPPVGGMIAVTNRLGPRAARRAGSGSMCQILDY